MEITPFDIIKEIEKTPPFQREEVAKNYRGLAINWNTIFYSLDKVDGDKVKLNLLDLNGVYPWIYCNVDLKKYPELKITKSGQRISVKGRIGSVDGHEINLDDCELKFSQQAIYDKEEKPKITKEQKNIIENRLVKKWWERTPVQIIMLLGAIAGIIALILFLK